MDPNPVPNSGTLAPYGRACTNCARAKAKCVTGNTVNAKCERYPVYPIHSSQVVKLTQSRCLRLNKDCKPIQTVRTRKTANRPLATKTERLEEKLDGLFKLLQSSTTSKSIADQNISVSTASTSTQPSPESLQSCITSSDESEDFGPHAIQRLDWNRIPAHELRLHLPTLAPDAAYVVSGTRSTIYHSPESSLIIDNEPSFDEAEECLQSFRSHMATYFPFIIVLESTTAQELRRNRPFLWLCIMSVASKSTVQQKALAKEVKITMGREILVEGKSNMDLLLGLLVFVAWCVVFKSCVMVC